MLHLLGCQADSDSGTRLKATPETDDKSYHQTWEVGGWRGGGVINDIE